MLESNGHFLCFRVLAEQRASKLLKAEEALTERDMEIRDLKVEVQTLR